MQSWRRGKKTDQGPKQLGKAATAVAAREEAMKEVMEGCVSPAPSTAQRMTSAPRAPELLLLSHL